MSAPTPIVYRRKPIQLDLLPRATPLLNLKIGSFKNTDDSAGTSSCKLDADYAPAAFRMVADDGTQRLDLWAYKE